MGPQLMKMQNWVIKILLKPEEAMSEENTMENETKSNSIQLYNEKNFRKGA